MVLQFITAPAIHVVKFALLELMRRLLWKAQPTQNSLNQLFEDNVIIISSSYAEVLVGVYVTLVYASAMPLLLWVAAFGFALKFWGDKWAVLRVYKKPPLYGPVDPL